jgi:uncharacterized membrane protein YfcA
VEQPGRRGGVLRAGAIVTLQLCLGLTLCLGIGLSLGLIGGGGSIVTVPVLVYALEVEPRQAIAMSLAVVGATGLLGAFLHHRRGAVRIPAAAVFAGAGVPASFLGARLTYLVSPQALLLTFAALMLVVGVRMAQTGPSQQEVRRPARPIKVLLAGLAVGLLTGFLGVGGGFLIVPALVLFAGLDMREAVGTSLLVIAINAVAGLAGHFGHGGFPVRLGLLVTLLAAAGALVGTHLSHRVSPVALRRGFSVFVVGVAVFLVFANRGALLAPA